MKKQQINCDIREDIVKIISAMLDNPDETGIYPTSKCYKEMEDFILEVRKQDKIAFLKRENELSFIVKEMKKLNKGDTVGFTLGRKHFTTKRDE